MKIKNNYAKISVIWVLSTLLNSVSCLVQFVDGDLAWGFILLLVAVSFSFVSGILVQKALEIRKHNQMCDWLHDIAEDLREQAINSIEPFDDLGDKNENS